MGRRAWSVAGVVLVHAGLLWALLSADNDRTRTRVRYALETAGFSLTSVWTRIDSNRRLIMLGGTLGSTQEQFALLLYLTNFPIELSYVQQFLHTPEPSKFPVDFSLGFNPYPSNTSDAVTATP
jgi:hypothetical protein